MKTIRDDESKKVTRQVIEAINSINEEEISDVDVRYMIRRKIEDRLDRKRLVEEFGPFEDDLDI